MSEKRHANLGIHTDAATGSHSATHAHHVAHAPILKRAKMISILIVLLLLLGAGVTVVLRVLHSQTLASATEQDARVFVSVIHAQGGGKTETITLPSTLQGIIEAPIYARSSGYVLRWKKDIGSSVVKDEVLAEIDTPEVDSQLAQAIAARAQSASSLDLAKTSAERWEELRKKDAVTQQELNERRSAYTQAVANVEAADANVQRLQKLEGFKKVLAPFSGVITRRNVEVGDLIDAGNGGAGRALFTMAQVDPLRLYVYVPQAFAQRINIGDSVSVTQNEMRDQVFQGKVVRAAGAIDAATRTLQMEINLPNHDNKLLAGSYVQVALSANGTSNVLRVPSNVLLFRPEGTRIAVVDNAGHVQLHTVTVGHDLGNSLEILSGITAADNLIVNPADSLADNDIVTVQKDKPEAAGKAHS
ncbi:efflux RND transporter periplasmic adaptor subunit [Solimicrobium silvestre]|uniref:Efflux transporter, RND family, MFP subunit n=1 Tax=Solimicrobium silvestre TaxID=2099400 RepID=A0A2S9GTT9_9BURK|nr:efflux RND transporter periplasmic adaptor subunit [Solimicrobium silvestre]PRC91118.1 Efflux transporter, RND family, MFP subunit [Solimicrobium silvestre]